jgi:ubiquinone/menaquinone biosynthesis C-methylase UbiE
VTTPQQQLSQLICGNWSSQCVYVAAKLGIADLLKEGPRNIQDLARETATHVESLYRLLRALASIGLFAEMPGQRFTLTPAADLLRSDVSGSQRNLAILMGEEHYRAWGDLLYSIQTGRPAFERIYGQAIFDLLSHDSDKAAFVEKAMAAVHEWQTAALLDVYDFSGFASVADIGGGNGTTLCQILRRYASLHGALFDLPGVIQRASQVVDRFELSDRIHLIAGDFFQSVPNGADAYLLRHIIHEWDDDKAIRILNNVHRAIDQNGRLLVVESAIPAGNEPFFGKLLDLNMLVIRGSRERTEDEFRHLFGRAGFRLARIVPTGAEVSVLEGIPE